MAEGTTQTNPSVPPQATPMPSGRPHRRRRARAVARGGRGRIIAVMVLAVILCVAAIVWGYRILTARIEAAERIDAATALIEDADAVVVQVDSVIRAKVTPELAEGASNAAQRAPEAKADLQRAVRLLDEARPQGSDDDRVRVDLLVRAASARIDMLDQAKGILDLNVAASEALPLARDAWDGVLAAAKLSDQAVSSYNRLTKAGVQASNKYNKQAAAQLAEARTRFAAADKLFSQAPFQQYLLYVDARIRLNNLSQQSDTAWLKGDVKRANDVAKTYNSEDKKAADLAKQLPVSPDVAIAEAYERTAKAATDAYYSARDTATEADAALRAR